MRKLIVWKLQERLRAMDKLTDLYGPPKTFHECQLCGYSSDEIVHFQKWMECDEKDEPTERFLITCNSEIYCPGRKMIKNHPRLYVAVEWGAGTPGNFILLCGTCKFRNGYECSHPNLKKNGGEGLEIRFSQTPLSAARICFYNGRSFTPKPPATYCVGNPERK